MAKKKEDPRLEPNQRIELFTKLQETTFKSSGVEYDKNNALNYACYLIALKNLGLANPFLMLKLPETLFNLDLSTESGIIGAIEKVAAEYQSVLSNSLSNPRLALTSLDILFRSDYNPKFEPFASAELSKINIDYKTLFDISEEKDEETAREEAEGTGLEGTISNPSIIANGILESIKFKYLKSFGASLDPAAEKNVSRDLFEYVQNNLSKDSPAKKETKASVKKEEVEDKFLTSKTGSAINVSGERTIPSKKEETSPINETEKLPEKEKKFLEPEKVEAIPVKSEVVSSPVEIPKEEMASEEDKKEAFVQAEVKKEEVTSSKEKIPEVKKEEVTPQPTSPINTISEKSEKIEKSESKISSFSELGQTLNFLPKETRSDIEKVYEKTLESSSINLKDTLKEKESKDRESKTSEIFKGVDNLIEKEKSSVINDKTSEFSSISNFDKELSEKKLEYLKSIGINIPGEETAQDITSSQEDIRTASAMSTIPGTIENKIEVAREKINFPQVEKEKINIPKLPVEESSPQVKEISEPTTQVKETQLEKSENLSSVSEKVDLTPLLMRLTRIEHLLSGTLEVKFVE